MDGRTGVDAQQTLEDMGLNVTVQKEYSEVDDDGNAMVELGYVDSISPEAGTSVSSGDTVTLTVSRGIDYGESVQVPDVVGLTKNDAVTKFSKFLNVEVKEEQSTDVAAGEVISQEPEADSWENPDTANVVITVSTGTQDTSQDTTSQQNTDSSTDTAADTAQQSTAAANGEVWKCTQALNTPEGYSGGLIRLELIQTVNGTPTASTILDGQTVEFPYSLDVTGAPGVSEGTICLYEEINGVYQKLGDYSVTFEKAE